jgi:hypothetical protein
MRFSNCCSSRDLVEFIASSELAKNYLGVPVPNEAADA